ncbi:THUMP domain-containing class I SAM-dependent RNA methyltransferase [Bacillus horti]|uniref:N6-adenine-specific DNA methylase n=1 Tax=Caldalkalibacillus horti TaxID=77523 RepID=A0ABT9W5E9_9BACI|nr:class I SAM-dependent RNA methyltransferase [Bacillus horti]MDQ0168477.1 putative N6-adenine-specific DNA methylase [Bacillus horti]
MKKIELIATSSAGLEAVVKQEVVDLGYTNVQVENGKVTYETDMKGIARSNLWLRTADRVKLKFGEFKAFTFDELFEKTKALPWEDILPKNAHFPVLGRSVKSKLFSISDSQAIVKKAIVEKLKQAYKIDWFPEDGPTYTIEIALHKDVATITLDTSGVGLHKRGYRRLHTEAPMKETMAAALLLISRWKPNIPLIDPFCGSGTIPIEAALIGQNIAPGFNRMFDAEEWSFIPKNVWDEALEEAEDLAKYDQKMSIVGSDIDAEAIELSKNNALEAGIGHTITFKQRDIRQLSSEHEYGYVICNPPYGERLGEKDELAQLYKVMGQVMNRMDTWSSYVFTSYEDFEVKFGKQASKKRKLYNGNIRCDFYQFFGPRPPKEILDREL